ncbi:hypothetical protein SAMN05421772_13127, partial [Paracoccus saliphilus]
MGLTQCRGYWYYVKRVLKWFAHGRCFRPRRRQNSRCASGRLERSACASPNLP